MTRSIILALFISVIGLLVIGGPIANALFQSPVITPAPAATISQASTLTDISPLVSRVSWVVFGAAIATGIILTVSRRPQTV